MVSRADSNFITLFSTKEKDLISVSLTGKDEGLTLMTATSKLFSQWMLMSSPLLCPIELLLSDTCFIICYIQVQIFGFTGKTRVGKIQTGFVSGTVFPNLSIKLEKQKSKCKI